jgi:hypothetical protein
MSDTDSDCDEIFGRDGEFNDEDYMTDEEKKQYRIGMKKLIEEVGKFRTMIKEENFDKLKETDLAKVAFNYYKIVPMWLIEDMRLHLDESDEDIAEMLRVGPFGMYEYLKDNNKIS